MGDEERHKENMISQYVLRKHLIDHGLELVKLIWFAANNKKS
jgi:hypothetical protein